MILVRQLSKWLAYLMLSIPVNSVRQGEDHYRESGNDDCHIIVQFHW